MVAGRQSEPSGSEKAKNESLGSKIRSKRTSFQADVPVPRLITPIGKMTKNMLKSQAGSGVRKRPKSKDEEEVFVAIEPARKTKKVRLTERQREKFIEQNENAMFFDEGFSQNNSMPLIARLPSEYMVDSQSQSGFSSNKSTNGEGNTDFCAFVVPDIPIKNGAFSQQDLFIGKENAPENKLPPLREPEFKDEPSDLSRQSTHKGDIWLDQSDDSDDDTLVAIKKKSILKKTKSTKRRVTAKRHGKSTDFLRDNSESKSKAVENKSYEEKEDARTHFLEELPESTAASETKVVEFGQEENVPASSTSNEECSSPKDENCKKVAKRLSSKDEAFSPVAAKKTPRKSDVKSKDIRSFLSPKNLIVRTKEESRNTIDEDMQELMAALMPEEPKLRSNEKSVSFEKPEVSLVDNADLEKESGSARIKKKRRPRLRKAVIKGKEVEEAKDIAEANELADSIEVIDGLSSPQNEFNGRRKDLGERETELRLVDCIETVEDAPLSQNDLSSIRSMVIEDVVENNVSEERASRRTSEKEVSPEIPLFEGLLDFEDCVERIDDAQAASVSESPDAVSKTAATQDVDTEAVVEFPKFIGNDSVGVPDSSVTPSKSSVSELQTFEKRTPGILKKSSPSSSVKATSEGSSQKPKRVHFDAGQDDREDSTRLRVSGRQPMSPITPRRKRLHAALFHDPNPSIKTGNYDPSVLPSAEVVKNDEHKAKEGSLFEELITCEDLLTPRMLTKLAPYGAQSLRMAFKSQGIKTIGDLASMTVRELSSLPVKAENVRDLLYEHAKARQISFKQRSEKIILNSLYEVKTSSKDVEINESLISPSVQSKNTVSECLQNEPTDKTSQVCEDAEDNSLADTQPLVNVTADNATQLNVPTSDDDHSTLIDSRVAEIHDTAEGTSVQKDLSLSKDSEETGTVEIVKKDEISPANAVINEVLTQFSSNSVDTLDDAEAVISDTSASAVVSTSSADSSEVCKVTGLRASTENGEMAKITGIDSSVCSRLEPLFSGDVLEKLQDACRVIEDCKVGSAVPSLRKREARLALGQAIEICMRQMRVLDYE